MSVLVLRWRVPDPPILTRWRGPDGSVAALAARDPIAPIAAVIGPPGPPGSQGLPYVHTQASALAQWVVNHDKGFRPLITVLSPGGHEVTAQVVHMSELQARIHFSEPTAGSAIVR